MNLAFEVGQTSTPEAVQFFILAPIAILAAIGILVVKKAVHAALLMAWIMITLAIFYISNGAAFLGVVQIIVYTGAVMMLFLFVVMLVGVDSSDSLVETIKGQRVAAVLFAAGFAALLISAIASGSAVLPEDNLDAANAEFGGNVQGIGVMIFTQYTFAFELTAALLITAALGAMLLAHRERYAPVKSQRDLSIERFSSGDYPGPKPPPGVYARHNAVDTPALLPDGTTSPDSVPGPLRARGAVRPVDTDDVAEVSEVAAGRAVIPGDADGEGDQR